MRNMLFGVLAGVTATTVMTMAMRRFHRALPPSERYPLPPREITEKMVSLGEGAVQTGTVAAHFAFGAFTGALYGMMDSRRPPGPLYGLAIWAASYLGWIPAVGILPPATQHPPGRNLLMLAAHLVWGTTLAVALRELDKSTQEVFQRPTRAGTQPRGGR